MKHSLPLLVAVLAPSLGCGTAGIAARHMPSGLEALHQNRPVLTGPSFEVDWVRSYFFDGSERSRSEFRIQTHELDIDHDGVAELWVWSRSNMGRSGIYLVFRQSEGQYHYIGNLHAGIYKVLPLAGDGTPRVACYKHNIQDEGVLSIYTNNGNAFVVISSDELHMSDDGSDTLDKKKFREAFGHYAYRQGRVLEY